VAGLGAGRLLPAAAGHAQSLGAVQTNRARNAPGQAVALQATSNQLRAGLVLEVRARPTTRCRRPTRRAAELTVLDLTGRLIIKLNLGVPPAGAHEVLLPGQALAPGLYGCRLQTAPSSRAAAG
jgi:hypothetical protein